ncbi:MAG TPA: hypothetical protein VLT90_16770 [Terriglobales bacterium]|nr:hypothetical protein [Terriglobales bacterium]
MLKLSQLLAAALLFGTCVFAQESTQSESAPAPKRRGTSGDYAEHRLRRLTKLLNLTDDQQQKLRPILQDEQKQMQSAEADTTLTQQQKHRKMKEIHRSSRAQMDTILTDEQKKLLGPERPQGGGRHHGRRAQPAPSPATTDSNNPQ